MASIDAALLDLKRLDRLASGDTALHRLDARAKVLVTLAFLVAVISFGRYELSAMIPFFTFPAAMVGLGNLPIGYLTRKVAVISALALMIGIFNPLFDREILLHLGSVGITGGWISCLSIVLRAVLTVSAGVVLVAVTGFPSICRALERLGLPRALALQLLFLYRYLFVLGEEGKQMSRARELRSFGKRGQGMASYSSLVGHLLMRTWQRAERLHVAMLARGFTGTFPTLQETAFGVREVVFVIGWAGGFVLFRLNNLSQLLGSAITGFLP